MPAFTFEKISPPTDRGSVQSTAKSNTAKSNTNNNNSTKKQRKLIVQILGRLAEARVRKSLHTGRSMTARTKSKTSD